MAHILLIDDDEFFRPMLRETLTEMGHTVTEAVNGNEGLARHADGGFDLVITDLVMPEKEGIETIMELRARDPALPLIAMSGGGRTLAENYLHIASKVGADWQLTKPFNREDLVEAIAVVMDRA
ncbi:MAG: response regulator [Burkholderiales bacterium]|nr:response regulator [Opitutaceae bacterium]